MYVASDASGSRTKIHQSVVTAGMRCSKEDKTSPEKYVNRYPKRLVLRLTSMYGLPSSSGCCVH